jgi:hypothetical protein
MVLHRLLLCWSVQGPGGGAGAAGSLSRVRLPGAVPAQLTPQRVHMMLEELRADAAQVGRLQGWLVQAVSGGWGVGCDRTSQCWGLIGHGWCSKWLLSVLQLVGQVTPENCCDTAANQANAPHKVQSQSSLW